MLPKMRLWICVMCTAIPSILFQGCSANAQTNSAPCLNGTKCDKNSNYAIWRCTPAVTCNTSQANVCPYRVFNVNDSSSSGLLRVWLDESIELSCNSSLLDIFGFRSNKSEKTVRFNKTDHGRPLSCYSDTHRGNFSAVVTVDVLMKPTTEETRKYFQSYGGPLSMKINFEANPLTVTRENITITHKNSTITNFFYRTVGLTHEIVLYFIEVTAQNEGEYVISIAAVDSKCRRTELVIVGVLGKSLHLGWIVSICLGGFSFTLLVAVIISRCRKEEDYGRSNVEMKTTGPALDGNPVNGSHQQVSNPQVHKHRPPLSAPPAQTQFPHGNPSYSRYSEDEFESDDSDDRGATTNTLDKRPPMPLPKENVGGHSPRRPGYVNGATNYPWRNGSNLPAPSRNLPPPTTSHYPASPGNRSLPPPPPQQHNLAYRGEPRY